jgi:hypothetical protein
MMSETASIALPVPHETPLHTDVHAHPHEPAAAPQSFAFISHRWKSGVTQGASGTGLLVMGAFLLSQISSTPALVSQLAILGAACSIGGLALLTKAVGDLFGKLVIDEAGIAIRPAFTGYAIAWNELSQWDVNLDADFPEAHSVRFWTPSSPCALSIPNSWLNHHDRTQVRRCLLSHAADKALRSGRAVGQ